MVEKGYFESVVGGGDKRMLLDRAGWKRCSTFKKDCRRGMASAIVAYDEIYDRLRAR